MNEFILIVCAEFYPFPIWLQVLAFCQAPGKEAKDFADFQRIRNRALLKPLVFTRKYTNVNSAPSEGGMGSFLTKLTGQHTKMIGRKS